MILGGILGLIIIAILSNNLNSDYEYINHIATINILTLIIIFCIVYLITFKIGKNSKMLKRKHLIIINSIIGAVFGLLVGSMSYEGEIFWFIIGFIIVSLIPIVNMFSVVFWLGATIYILYNPNIMIPIFHNFIPIKLVDGSSINILGLPLFIIPILLFFGYLLPASLTKSQNKKKVMLSKISEQKELKNEMNSYESKLKKWEFEGYDTTILQKKLKACNLSDKIQNLREYESKIQKIKQFKIQIQQMDIKEFDYDIISIKKKFKQPYKVDEIESDISALKNRIKLKIEKLVEKTDYEIKNATRYANKSNNSEQLNYLKILQDDLLKYSKDLDSKEVSYKDPMSKIKEIYNKVINLNVSFEKEKEMPPETQMEKPNYYEILNIKPNATQNQIKKMFKRLSLAFHPDTEEDTGVDGDLKFRMINEAYETLKDPDKRKEYDKEIGIKK
jgi:hypothetical protein